MTVRDALPTRGCFGLGKFSWFGVLLIQVIQLGIFRLIHVKVDINHTIASCYSLTCFQIPAQMGLSFITITKETLYEALKIIDISLRLSRFRPGFGGGRAGYTNRHSG